MRKSTPPKGGSILACTVTQGRLRCTCQPCAIESITPMGYGHTAWFGAIECAIRWVWAHRAIGVGYRMYNVMRNGTPRGWVKMGRGGAYVPARVALQGRIHRSIPRASCVYFLVWKRRCADVRAGTQAPPLRFRLGRLCVEWFCLLVGENGAHEPTPSVLYF